MRDHPWREVAGACALLAVAACGSVQAGVHAPRARQIVTCAPVGGGSQLQVRMTNQAPTSFDVATISFQIMSGTSWVGNFSYPADRETRPGYQTTLTIPAWNNQNLTDPATLGEIVYGVPVTSCTVQGWSVFGNPAS